MKRKEFFNKSSIHKSGEITNSSMNSNKLNLRKSINNQEITNVSNQFVTQKSMTSELRRITIQKDSIDMEDIL